MVGELPPEMVAESLNVPPRLIAVADKVVETLGLVLPTVTISEPYGA